MRETAPKIDDESNPGSFQIELDVLETKLPSEKSSLTDQYIKPCQECEQMHYDYGRFYSVLAAELAKPVSNQTVNFIQKKSKVNLKSAIVVCTRNCISKELKEASDRFIPAESLKCFIKYQKNTPPK